MIKTKSNSNYILFNLILSFQDPFTIQDIQDKLTKNNFINADEKVIRSTLNHMISRGIIRENLHDFSVRKIQI